MTAKQGCLKSHFRLNNCYLLFLLQRVNPLVPRRLQNLEPTDLPVGAPKRRCGKTFETALLFFLFSLLFPGEIFPQSLPHSVVNAVNIEEGEPPGSIIRKAAHVRPSERQARWQEMEFTVFIHFGMNTFTGREWGTRDEDPARFNPTDLDAGQWVQTAKMAGAKLIIMVAKHHDGFCLWPSEFTEFSVKNSPWKGGKGDVISEVASACREYGLKLGIYLSPWDLNSPLYGTEEYNEYFKNQLRELLTNYGEISEVWFDGACGEGPNGRRQVYDWPGFYRVVRELQPGAVIAVTGPDVRWVGTESGYGRETEWSVIPVAGTTMEEIAESTQESPSGIIFSPLGDMMQQDLGSREKIMEADGLIWYPSEVDVSIRPRWFYHPEEDSLIKSPEELFDIYISSVGRNSLLLLNVPPDRRGLIHENDVKSLAGFRQILDSVFSANIAASSHIHSPEKNSAHLKNILDSDPLTFWTPGENQQTCSLEIELAKDQPFSMLMLQENFRNGQRVEEFVFEAKIGGRWQEIARGTTIGYKRILQFEEVKAGKVRLKITASRDNPEIAGFGLFRAPPGSIKP
jgi:alpha-L-fucosidase